MLALITGLSETVKLALVAAAAAIVFGAGGYAAGHWKGEDDGL